jgi:hypothetical protein
MNFAGHLVIVILVYRPGGGWLPLREIPVPGGMDDYFTVALQK